MDGPDGLSYAALWGALMLPHATSLSEVRSHSLGCPLKEIFFALLPRAMPLWSLARQSSNLSTFVASWVLRPTLSGVHHPNNPDGSLLSTILSILEHS